MCLRCFCHQELDYTVTSAPCEASCGKMQGVILSGENAGGLTPGRLTADQPTTRTKTLGRFVLFWEKLTAPLRLTDGGEDLGVRRPPAAAAPPAAQQHRQQDARPRRPHSVCADNLRGQTSSDHIRAQTRLLISHRENTPAAELHDTTTHRLHHRCSSS